MGKTQSERTLSNFLGYLDGLRERGAVHFDEEIQAWHVLGYHDTLQVLTDPETFSSDVDPLAPDHEDSDPFNRGNFLRADDPKHRRLRGVVGQAFTPKMIAGLEPRIVEMTTRLLDEADARGDRWDLVEELGYPLPFLVIAEMLGVPTADRAFVQRLSDTFLELRDVDPEQAPAAAEGNAAGGNAAGGNAAGGNAADTIAPLLRELNLHLLEIVRARRRNPGDDMTSRLLAVEVDGVRLDDEEAVGFLNLLLAGHVTATSTMGNTALALDENPGVWKQLRADPELIPAAIEESMRFRPPFPRVGRKVTRDTEVGGQEIPAGAFVRVWLTAANRDVGVFDDPDRFDIHRTPNPHLAFGRGIHFCLGAPLARLEIKTAIRLMLERYSDFRVRADVPVNLRNPWVIMGVNKLPIEVCRY